MKIKTVEIDGIKINLKKNRQNKKIKLKINQNGNVLISLPFNCTFFQAIEFAKSQIDWIKKNVKKMTQNAPKIQIFDENTIFSTKHHILFIEKNDIKKSLTSIKNGKIHIRFPKDENILIENNQQKIKKAILEALRLEAKEFLPKRLDFWSKKYNLNYNEVNIKNMKSRWGSCASNGYISLNLHLIKLPIELIDYVLLHELAHIKHPNHSERFWIFLDKICPNSIELNQKLRFYKVDF